MANLAISAKRFSGKTMIAKYILDKYPELFSAIISIGKPLKDEWVHKNGLPVPTDPKAKEHWRKFITRFADNQLTRDPGRYAKQFRVNYSKAVQRLKEEGKPTGIVCDDLRQDSVLAPELGTVLILGFTPLRIECPQAVRKKFGMLDNPACDQHCSETGLDNHQYWKDHPECVLHNTGDLNKLKADVDAFIKAHFKEELGEVPVNTGKEDKHGAKDSKRRATSSS